MVPVIWQKFVPRLSNFSKLEHAKISLDCQKLTKAKFTVKYITKSVSEFPHAASNSKRKFLSASTSQLHKILLFNNTYWWLGILIGMLLLYEPIIFLFLGQFAKII